MGTAAGIGSRFPALHLVCPDAGQAIGAPGCPGGGVDDYAEQVGLEHGRGDGYRATPPSDTDLQGGAPAVVGGHRLVRGHPARREYTYGPGPRGGEEAEPAVLAERNLGDEVAAVVEQPGITGRRRCPVPRHLALDDGLARCAGGHGDTPGGCTATLLSPGRLLG